MRDYADACFRYLRATGMVNVSHIGKSLSIVPEKIIEIDYFLENTEESLNLLIMRVNISIILEVR